MSNLRWGKLHSNDQYIVLHQADKVAGWVVKINDVWIARTADATVRAQFDTMEEAQNFLTIMVSANE